VDAVLYFTRHRSVEHILQAIYKGMPELPEVETVARGVHERVHGERIHSAWFSEKPEPFKTPPAEMAEVLTGRTIDRVRRVGKHIVFDLSPGRKDADAESFQWIVHLGMTGRLLVSDANVPVPLHTHGVLHLASGRELRFVDARRFGRMGLHRSSSDASEVRSKISTVPGKAEAGGFTGTGREPLTISGDDFRALFHDRKTSIKAALLNQALLHGVGNIYADESLFWAGIRPRKMAARLTRAELNRLHTSLVEVLKAAISLGGSSVSDYVDADGVRGFFQLEHRVYMRTGKPCLVCQTPIRRIVVAGRGTHYCSRCQH
jgi:formamidopyrimidine-DNA glycosylase